MGFCVQHTNPIGNGLATEAIVEAAGPECIVPGQITPIKLLGVKVIIFRRHHSQKDSCVVIGFIFYCMICANLTNQQVGLLNYFSYMIEHD